MKIEGGCHCGRISYEAVLDPEVVSVCHCTDCQMLTGSAFRVTVGTVPGSFVLRSGEPKIYVKTADSGRKRIHGFCAECGTPLFARPPDDEGAYSVRYGSIRQREGLRPTRQIWCRSAVPWLDRLPEIARYDTI